MQKHILKLIMAILMIAAIYFTFRYKVIPSSTIPDNTKVIVVDPGHGGSGNRPEKLFFGVMFMETAEYLV